MPLPEKHENAMFDALCTATSLNQTWDGRMIHLDHHLYNNLNDPCVQQSSKPQPFLTLTVAAHPEDYRAVGFKPIPMWPMWRWPDPHNKAHACCKQHWNKDTWCHHLEIQRKIPIRTDTSNPPNCLCNQWCWQTVPESRDLCSTKNDVWEFPYSGWNTPSHQGNSAGWGPWWITANHPSCRTTYSWKRPQLTLQLPLPPDTHHQNPPNYHSQPQRPTGSAYRHGSWTFTGLACLTHVNTSTYHSWHVSLWDWW